MLGAKEKSVISELMCTWYLMGTLQNPPLANRIPSKLLYLREYGLDMAYVSSMRQVNHGKSLNERYMKC